MRHIFELETKGAEGAAELDGPVVDALAALQTAMEAKTAGLANADDVKALSDRVDAELAKLKRPGATGEDEKKAASDLEKKAFTAFVRGGPENVPAEERKALVVSDQTAGGYLAPAQFVTELDRNLVLMSPVRTAARVSQTGSGSVILPKRTKGVTAQWVGETETRPEDQPAYGQTEITVFEAAVYVDVSNWMLEDSAFDIASELSFDFAEEFGRLEGAAFLNGNGVKKPVGIINTPGIAYLPTGAAGDFGTNPGDNLIDLLYALPGVYAANGSWGMNRTTMGKIRKVKDSTGNYIWQDSLQAGQPPLLLGRPVVEMPDLADVGAGAYPIVFGDFNYFRIFDRVNLSVLRDPYTQAVNGKTRFHARRRVGAGVTKPEAFRFLKIAAS